VLHHSLLSPALRPVLAAAHAQVAARASLPDLPRAQCVCDRSRSPLFSRLTGYAGSAVNPSQVNRIILSAADVDRIADGQAPNGKGKASKGKGKGKGKAVRREIDRLAAFNVFDLEERREISQESILGTWGSKIDFLVKHLLYRASPSMPFLPIALLTPIPPALSRQKSPSTTAATRRSSSRPSRTVSFVEPTHLGRVSQPR
jgi:hypothetical protein